MKRSLRRGRDLGQGALRRLGRVAGRLHERSDPRSDLLESEDAYLIVLDAPGASPADVQVRYDDGSVKVRVDRFRDHHEGFEMLYPGRGLSFDAAVSLPADADVDPSAGTAVVSDDGTLRITVPKAGPETDDAVGTE